MGGRWVGRWVVYFKDKASWETTRRQAARGDYVSKIVGPRGWISTPPPPHPPPDPPPPGAHLPFSSDEGLSAQTRSCEMCYRTPLQEPHLPFSSDEGLSAQTRSCEMRYWIFI